MNLRRSFRRALLLAAAALALAAVVPGPAVAAEDPSSDAAAPSVGDTLSIDGHEPGPVHGSQRYWDFTGDERVSHADVQAFFAHHFYPRMQNRTAEFDYNRNGVVGHGDVVRLFRVVGLGYEPWNASASVTDAPAEVHAGDPASVDLDLEGASQGWVTLRQESGDYEATVRLDDVALDGDVSLRANTADLANGTPTAAFSASGATVDATETTESGSLEQRDASSPDATSLEVAVATRGPTAAPGDATTVELLPGSVGSVTTLVAPANATLSTPAEIRAQSTSASYPPEQATLMDLPAWGIRNAVARGDHLVVAVNASGVYGSLSTDPGQLGESGVDVELVGPKPGLGTAPGGSLGEFATNHTRVVPAPDSEQFYVVLESGAFRNRAGSYIDLWYVSAHRDGSATPLRPDGVAQSASENFRVDVRRVGFDAGRTVRERVAVAPTANATVRANTTVAPGTAATVAIQIGEETLTRTTTVGANRTVAATFDLSDRAVGGAIERVRVAEAGGAAAESTGLLAPPSDVLRSGVAIEASAPDTVSVGGNATVEVTLRNEGDRAGYAPARVEVGTDAYRPVESTWTRGDGNGTLDVVTPHLEPGETWTARYHFEATDARLVRWSVEATGNATGGSVVVEDPRATVNASALAASWGEDVEVPIEVEGSPDSVYVDLRRSDDTLGRTIEIRNPEEELLLRWDSAETGGASEAFEVRGGTLEKPGVVGYAPKPGRYEVSVGTRVPIVTRADDSATVVVGDDELDGVHAEAAGDVVDVPVGTATDRTVDAVAIRAANDSYAANLTLSNASGDATLRWNTHGALADDAGVSVTGVGTSKTTGSDGVPNSTGESGYRTGGSTSATTGSTNVTVDSANLTVDSANVTASGDRTHLAPGRYDVLVRSDGETVERRRVVLTRPDVEGVTPHATHRQYPDWTPSLPQRESPATVVEGAVRRDRLAAGDRLVAELRVSGLEGAVDDATPERLADAGLEVTLSSDAGASVDLLNASDAAVVARPAADRVYAIVDTRDLPGPVANRSWTIAAALDGRDHPHLVDGQESRAATTVELAERDVRIVGEFDDEGRLLLPRAENATIDVRTNVAPGTAVDVRLPLLRDFRTETTATVRRDGTASPVVDLGGLEDGTQPGAIHVRVPDSDGEAEVHGIFEDGNEAS